MLTINKRTVSEVGPAIIIDSSKKNLALIASGKFRHMNIVAKLKCADITLLDLGKIIERSFRGVNLIGDNCVGD